MIDLDKAVKVGEAATGGKWKVDDLGDDFFAETNHKYGIGSDACEVYRVAKIEGLGERSYADAEFIVYARNHWQELLDEIRKLRAGIETLRQYADETFDYWDSNQDSKVGKRLKAMSGRMPIYDAKITEVLELVATKPPTVESQG